MEIAKVFAVLHGPWKLNVCGVGSEQAFALAGKYLSNAPSQIWLDGLRDHQPCIFKMLVARSRIERTSLSSTSSFTHTFIRQIQHQSIAFILILLSSISITQFRQYNTNPIFIQHVAYPVFCSNADGSRRVDVLTQTEPARRPRRRLTVRGWGGNR